MRALLSIPVVLALGFSQTWVARYNGLANDEDRACGIAVTEAGSVCVTGSSWSSTAANDLLTITYSPSGESLWAVRYDGAAHGDDQARAVVARGENVFVTGGCSDASLWTDMFTVSYDATGGQRWAALYNGPGNRNDHGLALAADDADNVYAAGYTSGDTTFWEMLLVKYDPTGSEAWASIYSTIDEDYCVGVAVDNQGHVYTAGNTGSPYVLNWDYVTIKYNALNGDTLWTRRYNGPADEHDEARAIAVDQAGNVIVTGASMGAGTNMDFLTIKYGPGGEVIWTERYDGPASGPDWAYALAVDQAGCIYVTGASTGVSTDFDYTTIKYNPDGSRAWVARYDGPASGFDEARAIGLDRAGNVYVTGASAGSGTRADYATVCYNSLGQEVWVQRYDGPASRDDEAAALALGRNGAVYVTGASAGSGTGTDYATVSYPTGGVQEAIALDAPGVRSEPTIVRRTLPLAARTKGRMLDACGREVFCLQHGANDISRLAPGVYFIRSESDVRRVVIGR
ncbi:MAG: hypothetical protein ABIK86_03060 [candidate division WOR-3 bacterium]